MSSRIILVVVCLVLAVYLMQRSAKNEAYGEPKVLSDEGTKYWGPQVGFEYSAATKLESKEVDSIKACATLCDSTEGCGVFTTTRRAKKAKKGKKSKTATKEPMTCTMHSIENGMWDPAGRTKKSTSSLYVKNGLCSKAMAVLAFADADYKGSSVAYCVGDHANVGGDWNDKISSIQIPTGLKVTVYKDKDFSESNDNAEYTESVANLADFNDVITSLKVVKI